MNGRDRFFELTSRNVRASLVELYLIRILWHKWFTSWKWFSKINFIKYWSSGNQEKLSFSALTSLIHFRKSLQEIRMVSLFLQKLFGRAALAFSREATPRSSSKQDLNGEVIFYQRPIKKIKLYFYHLVQIHRICSEEAGTEALPNTL